MPEGASAAERVGRRLLRRMLSGIDAANDAVQVGGQAITELPMFVVSASACESIRIISHA